MSKSEQKYSKDKNLSDLVAKTKVSHGRIEAAVRVREAKSKKEMDIEIKRLKILNEIDKSSIGEKIILPSELKHWQQLVLIIGSLNLKTTTEILLACKKLGYSGKLDTERIVWWLGSDKKEYFEYDKERGWFLTNKGQNEFSRLKQFI